ncbi:Arc family DNA-binding protein [Gilliamella sp. B2923]|uniref:Arc family DNA-binding protein n=1 Tax=unclassified Gilliamella TaxID=2685620 RepID=UPI001C696EF7|nr:MULTISPECIES: Arc family DNA-binding protein [unclassified Gilliamella]MCX8617673.1 Arc family DNA-binding protein [Gilliamella sp. B2923]QYN46623.1 Arc family DNA-binding protein [Gilliamella sp. ESL0405]
MTTIKPFPTRLPSDLRSYLEEKANVNKRSLNNELVDRLEVTRVIKNITQINLREIIYEILILERYKNELKAITSEYGKLRDSYVA